MISQSKNIAIIIFLNLSSIVFGQNLHFCNDVQFNHSDKELNQLFVQYSKLNYDKNKYNLKYSPWMLELLCSGYEKNDSARIALGAFLMGKIENKNPYKAFKEQLLMVSYHHKSKLKTETQFYILKEIAEHYRINHNFTKALFTAEEMKKAAIRAGKKYPEAHYLLLKAKIYLFLEKTDEAKSFLDKIIANYPKFEDMAAVYLEMAAILKTSYYLNRHDLAKAKYPLNPIPYYNKAIELSDNINDKNKVYNDMAHYYNLKPQTDSALFYFNKVRFEKDTLYYDYIYHLIGKGSVYKLKKENDKAKKYFETALKYSKKYQYKRLQYMSAILALTVSVDDYTTIRNAVIEIDSAHLGLIRYSEEKELFYQIQDSLSQNQLKISQLNLEKQIRKNQIRSYLTIISIIGFLLLTTLSIGYIYRRSSKKTKKANEILKQKQRELMKVNQKLNEVNERLDQFSSIAAHDMKNSLSGIMMISQFTKEKLFELKHLDLASDINELEKEARKLIDFMNYLLQNARNKNQNTITEINLPEIFEEVKKTLAIKAKNHQMEIHGDIPYLIKAEFFEIYQLFLNFMDNAIKYGVNSKGEKSILKVTADSMDKLLTITFRDNGDGIPEEESNKIMQQYYQVIQEEKKKDGIGLGLHICSEIVAKYNGSIAIDSTLGEGTTFTIHLELEAVKINENSKWIPHTVLN